MSDLNPSTAQSHYGSQAGDFAKPFKPKPVFGSEYWNPELEPHNTTREDANQVLSDLTVWMKYARYRRSDKRRETWGELCNRNRQMHLDKYPQLEEVINRIYDELVIPKKVLPSMRSMQFAGAAINQQNSRIFNCAYTPVDSIEAFGEIMFLLLGGTGMGFSVQNRHISQLPVIENDFQWDATFVVPDTIEGWGDAVKELLTAYTDGEFTYPVFDLSQIRPKGAELVTSGGKAPGPEPLRICLQRIEAILRQKQNGTQLTDIECHDIVCHIADAVYAGGIRRAALISLFDNDSEEMLNAKSSTVATSVVRVKQVGGKAGEESEAHDWIVDLAQGDKIYYDVVLKVDEHGHSWDFDNIMDSGSAGWWVCNGQRARANNSVVMLRGNTTKNEFFRFWKAVVDSGSGEPGIYWTNDLDWGTNPCVETALRPCQFCNLVEINASDIKDEADFHHRLWGATILGTLQSGYTNFNYLRPIWRENTEKDALLGVSMTGIASRRLEQLGLDLGKAGEYCKEVNAWCAERIGVNQSARITCIKPAGTTSLTLGTSSGVHAWHSKYYIRRVRVGKHEAIYNYLLQNNPALVEDCKRDNSVAIVSVPQVAPEGSLMRGEETALEMLDRIKRLYETWVVSGHNDGINTHNISATVSVKNDEWDAVGNWMWENKDCYNGISVFPYDGGTYVQAPFETIEKARYNEMLQHVANIDLAQVWEEQDGTDLVHEVACAGGVCELPQ